MITTNLTLSLPIPRLALFEDAREGRNLRPGQAVY